MDEVTVEAYEIALYHAVEQGIEILKEYRAGKSRYIRHGEVDRIIMLLRNYRREKFGSPITDRERRE